MKKSGKSFKKKFIIFTISILLVAMVGLALFWFYIKPKNEKPVTPPDTSISVVAQMKDQIEQLNQNMENMMIVLYDKEMTIQTMSVELEETTDELNSTKRAMDTLCDEIDAKNLTITQLENDKAVLQSKFDELSQDVTSNKEEIEKVKIDLEKISKELDKAKTDLESMQTRLSEIETNINALESKVTQNENDIATVKSDVATIKMDIEELKTKVQKLEQSVEDLQNSVITVVESGSNYIRYNNAIQMSWGNSTTDNFVGFGKAFKDTSYSVVCTYTTSTSAWESVLVTWKGTDSCYVASGATSNHISFNFLAIGYWN